VSTKPPRTGPIPVTGVTASRIPSVVVVSEQPEVLRTLAEHLRRICSELIECSSLEEGMKNMAHSPGFEAMVVGGLPLAAGGRLPAAADSPERDLREGEDSQIVGKSQSMEAIRRMVLRVAPSLGTVFLTGEPGSGKKQLARAIHRASSRGNLPLVIVECGAESEASLEKLLFQGPPGIQAGGDLAQGLLGSAQIGTVFLGDVDDAPLATQRKLLQAIENHGYYSAQGSIIVPVRVRLIVGAGADVIEKVAEGRFLLELKDRLALLEISVPPLRERLEDLPELARHLVDRLSRIHLRPGADLDPGAEKVLMGHSWPWNVRELRNVLERALILLEGRVIRETDLPRLSHVGPSQGVEDLAEARRDFERQHIDRILLRYGGDKPKAAKAMGVDVSTLYRKMRVSE
jgi:DNA-binding NtrC family response regulator